MSDGGERGERSRRKVREERAVGSARMETKTYHTHTRHIASHTHTHHMQACHTTSHTHPHKLRARTHLSTSVCEALRDPGGGESLPSMVSTRCSPLTASPSPPRSPLPSRSPPPTPPPLLLWCDDSRRAAVRCEGSREVRPMCAGRGKPRLWQYMGPVGGAGVVGPATAEGEKQALMWSGGWTEVE